MTLVTKGGLGWLKRQAVSSGGGALAIRVPAVRGVATDGGHRKWLGTVSVTLRSLLDDFDPSKGLAMRACVSERRWLDFSYVL